jgi:hypothetical protein
MAADISTSLVHRWRFNEVSGSSVDSVGSATGTETSGTIDSVAGLASALARDFEAGDTEYFDYGDNGGTLRTGDADFTYLGWIKYESFPANCVVMNKGWQGAGVNTREFVFFNPSSASIRFTVGVGIGAVDHAHTFAFVTGRWYPFAAWHDSVNNTLNIQIDNGAISSVAHATGLNSGNGAFQVGASPTQGLYFDGAAQEFWKFNRVLTAEDRHAWRLQFYSVQTYYVDPNAAGANNGTSFANAYTSLSSAATAMLSDDQLKLNSTLLLPYVGGQHFNANQWGIDLTCSEGAAGAYYSTNGRLMSTATGPTSGVFSQTVASKPSHVVWDWKADSDGSVTGWAYDDWDVELMDRWSVPAAMRPVYYGFLEEDTSTPTTPAEGKWGHNGTTLYINPPGAPDQATVRTTAKYCLAGSHGIGLLGCSKGTFTGPAYFDLYPSTASSEYALFGNGQDMTIEDVYVRQGGWHAVGFAGGSPIGGPRNTLRNIIVNGTTGDEASAGSVNGCVFYQPNTATEFGGHLAEDIVLLGAPRFLSTGDPATTNWAPQPCLVHSDGGVVTMSATWRRVLCIDKTDELEAFHAITNANVGSNSLANGTIGDAFDYTTYPQLIQDSYFRGRIIPAPAGQTSYENCFFDRHNCGRSDLLACTAFAVTGAVAFKDCFFILGDHSVSFFDSWGAADALIFDNCKFLFQASTSKACLVNYISAGTGTNRLRFVGCKFDSADATKLHGVVKGNATSHAANYDDVFSDGNNVFGTGVTPIYNSDGSVSRDITWWNANIEGGSTDRQRNLGWGSTEADKVDTLRQWWATGNAPGTGSGGPAFSPAFSPGSSPYIVPLPKLIAMKVI